MAFIDTVKGWFKTKDKPTQTQFYSLFNWLRWKDEQIPINEVENLNSLLTAKAERATVNAHIADNVKHITAEERTKWNETYSLSPISGTNTVTLLKNGNPIGDPIDLTPYLDDSNLARLVSGSVDANGLATFTRDDDSTFTVDLSNLKDNLSLAHVTGNGATTNDELKVNRQSGQLGMTVLGINNGAKVQVGTDFVRVTHTPINSINAITPLGVESRKANSPSNGIVIEYPSANSMNDGFKQLKVPYKSGTIAALDDVLVSVLDHNGTEKFKTKEVQFDENFEFNSAEHEIKFKASNYSYITSKLRKSLNSGVNDTNKINSKNSYISGQHNYELGKIFYASHTYNDSDLLLNIKNKLTKNFSTINAEGTEYPNQVVMKVYLKPKNCKLFYGVPFEKVLLFEQTLDNSSNTHFANKPIDLDIIITGHRSVNVGGVVSNYFRVYSKVLGEDNELLSESNGTYYQVRTLADEPMLLEDCEFVLEHEVEVKYADSTNANGNNKKYTARLINVYTLIESI